MGDVVNKLKTIECKLDYFIERIPELESNKKNIWAVFLEMIETYEKGGKILVCGNGGSAADADHITGELMKGFMLKRALKDKIQLPWISAEESEEIQNQLQQGLPALNLCAHTALITASANDINPELIYAQQILPLGNQDDLYIGISTSGNSKNVYYGGVIAKSKGMTCIALTGKSGGIMREHFDLCINVPSDSTPIIQEYHLPIYHELCKWVEEYFFSDRNEVRLSEAFEGI